MITRNGQQLGSIRRGVPKPRGRPKKTPPPPEPAEPVEPPPEPLSVAKAAVAAKATAKKVANA